MTTSDEARAPTLAPRTPSTYDPRADRSFRGDGRSEITMPKKFKGPAARALDAWWTTGDVRKNLEEARDLLRSPRNFRSIVAALSHGKPEFVHPTPNSVLQGKEFERVAREGYLRAIGFALGHNPPVPITTTWETGAGNAKLEIEPTDGVDHVEVTVRVPEVEIEAADEQPLGLTDVRTVD
jgi:hypothetical protein